MIAAKKCLSEFSEKIYAGGAECKSDVSEG